MTPLMTLALTLLLQSALIVGIAVFIHHRLMRIVSQELDVPFVPTKDRAVSTIAQMLCMRPGDTIYELGSGDARVLLALAARTPQSRFIGIERNPLLHARAMRKLARTGLANVELRRSDLFTADLSDARGIYAYLLDPVMDRLLPKFETELSECRVVSCAFRFSGKKPSDVVALDTTLGHHGENRLYAYTFGR